MHAYTDTLGSYEANIFTTEESQQEISEENYTKMQVSSWMRLLRLPTVLLCIAELTDTDVLTAQHSVLHTQSCITIADTRSSE